MSGVARVKELIANRAPLLLVDEVLVEEPGARVVTRKAVTVAEPCYQRLTDDTAAEDYAYPAALLIESWCQSAAVLAALTAPMPEPSVALAGTLRSVHFGAPVYPGTVLTHEVRLVRAVHGKAVLTGETSAGDTRVLTVGQFVVARAALTTLAGVSAAGEAR